MVVASALNPTSAETRSGWIEPILGATLIFNLVDIIMTLSVVLAGLAVEANPVMAALLAGSPLVFVLGKLALVFAGVHVLWRQRHRRLAVVGSVTVFAAYALLMVYHLQSVRVLIAFAIGSTTAVG